MTVPLDRVPGIPALARGLATGKPDVSEFLPRSSSRAAVAAQAASVLHGFRPRTLPATRRALDTMIWPACVRAS